MLAHFAMSLTISNLLALLGSASTVISMALVTFSLTALKILLKEILALSLLLLLLRILLFCPPPHPL